MIVSWLLAGGLRVYRSEGGWPPFADFEGKAPTPRQLRWIAKRKLSVCISQMPEGVTDLSFLVRLGADLKILMVQDYECRDVRAVEQLTELRGLTLWVDSRQRADLSALPLEHFSGYWHKSLDSVLECTTLKRLHLEKSPGDVLSRVPQTVEYLRLAVIKGRKFEVGSLGSRAGLVELDLGAASEVDLAGIEDLEGLQRLTLKGVSHVRNAEALSRSRSLRKLWLEDCRSVDGLVAALEGWGLEEVAIVGSAPWVHEARRLVHEKGMDWVPVQGTAYEPVPGGL